MPYRRTKSCYGEDQEDDVWAEVEDYMRSWDVRGQKTLSREMSEGSGGKLSPRPGVPETAAPKKGIRSCRVAALTSVMSKWYATCVILHLEKRKKSPKDGNVGDIDGISCQHPPVMMTQLLTGVMSATRFRCVAKAAAIKTRRQSFLQEPVGPPSR